MPARIETLTVINPRTSMGVESRAHSELDRNSSGIIELVCKELQEVPTPAERKLNIRVYNILTSRDAGQLIRGVLMDGIVELDDRSVTISTESDGNAPATITLVSTHE